MVTMPFFFESGSCMPKLLFGIPPYKFLLCEDVNGDGQVSREDLFIVAENFGKKWELAAWNLRVDVNQDGIIDILDAVQVALVINPIA